MSFEEKLAEAKLRQKKGEYMEKAQESGVPLGGDQPTEYAKAARYIVEKNQSPETLPEQIYQSNIPKAILPNVMMLHGINKAIEKLHTADVTLIADDKVILYNESDELDSKNQPVLTKYRVLSQKGYNHMRFWDDYWHNMQAGLMLALPAVDGGVRKDGVTMVSSITNSDRALLEAQNNQQAGLFKRGFNKLFGGGK